MVEALSIDADIANADAIKASWDVFGIRTRDDLLNLIGGLGLTIDAFKRLPVYRLNVDSVDVLKEL